jgi:opacity protein-like surface antigen
MLKPIIRILILFTIFFTITIFAKNDVSIFHQQGYFDEETIPGESYYFAVPVSMPSKTNWYFGLGAGISIVPANTDVTSTVFLSPGTGVRTFNTTSGKTVSYGGGIYGGVGTNINKFYIAGELGLNGNFLNKDFLVKNNATMSVKQPIAASLDVIPGYLINNGKLLFYGRFGLGSGLVKAKIEDYNYSSNNLKFGLRAGFGIEYRVSDNFGFRTEYLYINYQKIADEYGFGGLIFHQVNLGLSFYM